MEKTFEYVKIKPMYNFQNTQSELSLQPFIGINKANGIYSICVVIIMVAAWFLPYFSFETKLIILMVGGMLLFYFLYDFLFRSRTKIIFDKERRKVYKSFAGVFKLPLYNFEDVRILNTSECGGNYYGIAHRKNRYGKNHAISDGFSREQEQEQFEMEILPEIYKALEG